MMKILVVQLDESRHLFECESFIFKANQGENLVEIDNDKSNVIHNVEYTRILK